MNRENFSSFCQSVAFLKESASVPVFEKFGVAAGFLGKNLGSNPDGLIFVKQVHGTRVVGCDHQGEEADGLIGVAGERVAVVTADCLPVLIADKGLSVSCAVHAGWRGLSAGIVARAVEALPVAAENLIVALGPCISQERFEVGPEVVAAFEDRFGEDTRKAVRPGKGDRLHVDLQKMALLELCELGTPGDQINVIQQCTFQGKEKWHSFRRDGAKAGRNVSWVGV